MPPHKNRVNFSISEVAVEAMPAKQGPLEPNPDNRRKLGDVFRGGRARGPDYADFSVHLNPRASTSCRKL